MGSAQTLFKPLQTTSEHARILFGIHGKTVLQIEDAELAFLFIESQLQFA